MMEHPAVENSQTIERDAPALSDIVAVLCAEFRVTPADSMAIAHAVLNASTRYGVSPLLLLAVIAIESSFDQHAVSVGGAKGLMQILPAAHPRLITGVRDLCDPGINVRIGSAILRDYLDAAHGDLDLALSRYSGGAKGYARRVVLRMRLFSASLHSAPIRFVQTAFADPG